MRKKYKREEAMVKKGEDGSGVERKWGRLGLKYDGMRFIKNYVEL